MRVMILTADYPPHAWSGIGITVERQAQALVSLGVEVDVLVAAKPPYNGKLLTKRGLNIHYLTCQRFPVDPCKFDLIHLHSLALSELAFELRQRYRLPLIYTVHALFHLELEGRPNARFWCAVQGRVLALCDRVIFLSEAELSAAVNLFPEILLRTHVIPNGIPEPPNRYLTFRKNEPIVFAGRFVKSKGIQMLVKMIPILLAKYRTQFILAGGHGDPECYRPIHQLAVRFPDGCRVVGWLPREELDRLFAKAALVLLPSLYEPFGLVALEAMRMGAPVLVSGIGSLAEIVKKESGGRQVCSRDPYEWTEAALAIVSDPEVSRQLSIQGPKYVANRYNLNQLTARLVKEVYTA